MGYPHEGRGKGEMAEPGARVNPGSSHDSGFTFHERTIGPVLKRETHLPVIVDPSHAAGRADIVPALAAAAVAVGADGLIVEVHPDPAAALSDGAQSLTLDSFDAMMRVLEPLAAVCGRILDVPNRVPSLGDAGSALRVCA